MDVGLIGPLFGQVDNLWLVGGCLLLLSMSVHLAQGSAATNRLLEEKVVEVEKMSAELLEHERAVREQELERRVRGSRSGAPPDDVTLVVVRRERAG